ncbi:hypothetical protein K1719_015431 [Acacia pycnantha]|nr:hypothetical protein K1719_015431 [Acacia pycnantha]
MIDHHELHRQIHVSQHRHIFWGPRHINFTGGDLLMHKFFQSKKSQRTMSVAGMGNKIPLVYVLWNLAKPKFCKKIACYITLDPKNINKPLPLKKSCTYD